MKASDSDATARWSSRIQVDLVCSTSNGSLSDPCSHDDVKIFGWTNQVIFFIQSQAICHLRRGPRRGLTRRLWRRHTPARYASAYIARHIVHHGRLNITICWSDLSSSYPISYTMHCQPLPPVDPASVVPCPPAPSCLPKAPPVGLDRVLPDWTDNLGTSAPLCTSTDNK